MTTFAYDRARDRPSSTPGTNPSTAIPAAKIEARDAAGDPRNARRTFEVAP